MGLPTSDCHVPYAAFLRRMTLSKRKTQLKGRICMCEKHTLPRNRYRCTALVSIAAVGMPQLLVFCEYYHLPSACRISRRWTKHIYIFSLLCWLPIATTRYSSPAMSKLSKPSLGADSVLRSNPGLIARIHPSPQFQKPGFYTRTCLPKPLLQRLPASLPK